MQATFVRPGDPSWDAAVSGMEHDVYHLPAYVAACAGLERGEPVAFLAEEGRHRLLVPLILRPIEPALADGNVSLRDATSPYGYPSPLLDAAGGDAADDFLGRAVDGLLAGLERQGVVTAFLRLHPILPLPLPPLARVGHLVEHGETVVVDLSLPQEELWRQTRRDHRSDINRALRRGQVARVDERWEHFETFLDIYYQTMERVGAGGFYFFPREYFLELRRTLADRLHLCVVEIEGEVAAVEFLTESSGIVQGYLLGTRDRFVAQSPTKLLLHFVRGWAKEQGYRFFHIGGGLGGQQDPLFAFKAGFSHDRRRFRTWRVVVDDVTNRTLVDLWRVRHGAEPDGPDGFFPAYRKPGG